MLARASLSTQSNTFAFGRVIYGFVDTAALCDGPSADIARPQTAIRQSRTSSPAQAIANEAVRWENVNFAPGKTEQCMYFVREVLFRACGASVSGFSVQTAWDTLDTSPGYASSFAGDGAGTRIRHPSRLEPGDLVFFKDTYPGDWPLGTITHVGIYIGKGEIIHRPTADRRVERTTVASYGNLFHSGVRLHSHLTQNCR